ncbi:hypothetical protein KI387_006243, partial [Taxus chinensis]
MYRLALELYSSSHATLRASMRAALARATRLARASERAQCARIRYLPRSPLARLSSARFIRALVALRRARESRSTPRALRSRARARSRAFASHRTIH